MPRIIEVTVSPSGEATVQTKGYSGGDCLAAARFLERALGLATADVKTASSTPARRPRRTSVSRSDRPSSPILGPGSCAMDDPEIPDEALATIERVAGAIRHELGEEVDAYPGGRSPEGADPLNRAFRAVVASILAAAGIDDLAPTVSLILRLVSSRRLAAEGWDPGRIKALIEEEPGSPDDWSAFLILSSRAQIEPLLDPDRH